jgi:hypothetical protein
MVSGLAVSADLKLFKPFKSPLGLGLGTSQVMLQFSQACELLCVS